MNTSTNPTGYASSEEFSSSVGSGGYPANWVESNVSTKGGRFFPTVLLIALGGVQGTGGATVLPDHSVTGLRTEFAIEAPNPSSGERKPIGVPIQLVTIRQELSLSVTDLARALQVERPTIYAWMRGQARPHQSNLKKINYLMDLAEEWKHLSNRPMGTLNAERLSGGQSFLDLLGASSVGPGELRAALRELSEFAQSKSSGRTYGMKSIAESLGFAPMPERLSEGTVAGETNYVSPPDVD